MMNDLTEVAPAFVEMAHRIVWSLVTIPSATLNKRFTANGYWSV